MHIQSACLISYCVDFLDLFCLHKLGPLVRQNVPRESEIAGIQTLSSIRSILLICLCVGVEGAIVPMEDLTNQS